MSGVDVIRAVEQARAAQRSWAGVPFARKLALLKAGAKRMLERRQEALEILHDEVGKSAGEALMTEAIGPLQLLTDAARVVKPYLASRKLPLSPLAFPGKSGRTEIIPRGVVGVIAPWNYPIGYFFKPVFPALLCGNAVVLKPSELSPRGAVWFTEIFSEFLPSGLLASLTGDGSVGQALIASGVDAITFTGSYRTGREVAKACAERMIPCSFELGGKDAAIVLADCALERTVAGVMQWGLHNAGQACGAIDRIYVEDAIADEFVARLARAVQALTAGDVGRLVNAAQLRIVEELVEDATRRGARLVCGGTVAGLRFAPTVLDGCDHSMRICREPTFGPVIPIVRVKDADEAVRLANDSDYGLCGSVWSENRARASELASRLEVGTAYVNNHSFTGGVASSPWTGVKHSGHGIANSEFALAHYTRPRTLVVDRGRGPDVFWFPVNGTLEELGHRLAEAQLGRIGSILRIPFLMSRRKREILSLARGERVSPGEPPAPRPTVAGPSGATEGGGAAPREAREFRLSALERRWCGAALEAIFEDEGAFGRMSPGEPLSVMEAFIGGVPRVQRVGLRAMICVAGVAPLLLGMGFRTLDRLPPPARLAVLERLAASRVYFLRQIVIALKSVGALSYASTTRVLGAPKDAKSAKRVSPPRPMDSERAAPPAP